MPSKADRENPNIRCTIGTFYKKKILDLVDKGEFETITHFIKDRIRDYFKFY